MVVVLVESKETPSSKAGLLEENENALRVYGCDLIQRAGIFLRVHQVTICSGQVIFHRFYYRQSFTTCDVRRTAAACLFIATKIEEDPRRLHHVVSVFHHVQQRELHKLPIPALDKHTSKFKRMTGEIQKAEKIILKELGFQIGMVLEHPHKFLLQFLSALQFVNVQKVATCAWGYCNDSLRTTCCCHYQATTITVAAIYLACCDLKIALPTNPPWWLVYDVAWNDIEDICKKILELYLASEIKYEDVLNHDGPIEIGEGKDDGKNEESDREEGSKSRSEKDRKRKRERSRDRGKSHSRSDHHRRKDRHRDKSPSKDRYGRDRKDRDRHLRDKNKEHKDSTHNSEKTDRKNASSERNDRVNERNDRSESKKDDKKKIDIEAKNTETEPMEEFEE